MTKVLFVCHGNICRSTMAQSLFVHMVNELGLQDEFEIYSAATSRDEIGNPPHFGTINKLKSVGIPVVAHKSVQITKKDGEYYDYIIAMDSANVANIEKIFGFKSEKVAKLLSFAGLKDDIADPWYSGDFDKTYDDIKLGLEGFLKILKR